MSAFRRTRIACPECGRGTRDDTCGVTVDDHGGVWHCFRCDATGYLKPDDVDEFLRGAVLSDVRPGSPNRALYAFIDALEITPKDPAGLYLLARRCTLPPSDGHLRWLPNCRHPSGHVGPALIALLSDPVANTFVTVHRTWITDDGSGDKADVDDPRLCWPGLPKKGGVCRLWPDTEVTHEIGLSEGIENALTLARVFTPVWACVDAGNLAIFPYIPPVEAITVSVDDDEAGERAFNQLRERWFHESAKIGGIIEITALRMELRQ